MKKQGIIITSGVVILSILLLVSTIFINPITVSGKTQTLSIDMVGMVADPVVPSAPESTTVTEEDWGYRYVLSNGDVVEVGDSSTTDFKAMIRTIRNTGICEFYIGFAGGLFIPTLDGLTVSFTFNDVMDVAIYPVEPSERLPEGGIEYDITLNSKPAQNTVSMDIDWTGITWTKLLPLDEEWDQAACEEQWGTGITYVITSTSISNLDTGEIYKTRANYEVNSYLGTAIQVNKNKKDYGLITDEESEHYGEHLYHSSVSRTNLYIHRGVMTDDIGQQSWVEDISLNESKKTITFTLDRDWLRNTAVYPIHQVCGVDPAYTEAILSSGQAGSDGSWLEIDLNTVFSLNLGTTNVVLEMMLENQQKGAENFIGVRNTSSSTYRYLDIHECEPDGGGGGDTHIRMFVQTITNGSSQQGIDIYTEDASDTEFYILGYWENTSFTEDFDYGTDTGSDVWGDIDQFGSIAELAEAERVYHIWCGNAYEAGVNFGVRTGGSGLDRKILLHEQEGDGYNFIDFLVKSDATNDVEVYLAHGYSPQYGVLGYFGSEMDFQELWQDVTPDSVNWYIDDITAYLDEDGRTCDFMCIHEDWDDPRTLGVRDGDDTTTNRYLVEHEAEGANDDGTDHEFTGFSMTATTNASGQYYGYTTSVYDYIYLTGYFLPNTAEADISVSPTSKNFGTVAMSTTYWSNGSSPSFPLTDPDAYFTITNNGAQCSITIESTNFTNWTLGSPAANVARLTAFKEGDGSGDGVTITTSPQSFITALTTNIDMEIKFETPTSTSTGAVQTATITLDATLD